MNGSELLAAYRETGSEQAFSGLVKRYTNLVFSIAKRRLANGPLAEDVTQTVFTRLAKAALKVKGDAELVAWLHRTTVHVAIDLWRSETRRHNREQLAAAMETTPAENTQLWEELAPGLDEALNELRDDDRQAVLLRFFEQKSMRDVGQSLGVSEDAAKMRVSRAIERLRSQLASRGVACAALALGGIIAGRSIEAAPAQLIAKLASIKFTTGTVGAATGIGLFALFSKAKLATAVTGFAFVGIAVFLLFHSRDSGNVTITATQSDAVGLQPTNSKPVPLSARPIAMTAKKVEATNQTKLNLRVIDAESGAGLPDAKIQAAYFYAGGVGEGHELVTDENGNAAVPESNQPGNKAMNLFVNVEGHVPIAMNFPAGRMPTEYVIKLKPALTIGGTVVNEQGLRLAGVKISVRRQGTDQEQAEHIDFQTCPVTTDVDGRWACSYIPKEYTTAQLSLTLQDYAVTMVEVPVGKPDSTNATLIIKQGFTVTGLVKDSQGQPIEGAEIRELNYPGQRRLSNKTAADGSYTLVGLSDWQKPPQVKLVVQTPGYAPQMQTVQLLERTNKIDFALDKGNVFRGRVINDAGEPIVNAVVQSDWDNQGLRQFEWTTRTDSAGRFEWNSAPAEPVLFWFEASDYSPQRGTSFVADGTDHEIKLTRNGRHKPPEK